MGNQNTKKFISSRKATQKEGRGTGHMQQNLVHEEFSKRIEDVYDIRHAKLLGKGGFGSVMAVTHRATGKHFAVKTVELKDELEAKDFNFILNEVELLKQLDHPNIVRVQEVYHTPACLYIVMDLYSGGDLFDRYAFTSEAQTADIMRKIINGVRYCHDQGIAHRDLKLENVVYESDSPDAEIKLVDFGLGSVAHEGLVRHDLVGSWVYMAPEVIRRAHSPKPADMWSLGVMTYCLLAGYPPFRSDTLKGLKHAILTSETDFKGSVWRSISAAGRDFVERLLLKDEESRMTAVEAQAHPWLCGNKLAPDAPLDPTILINLRRFQHTNLMKKVALGVVARTLEADDLRKLEAEFAKADVDHSGVITINDFREAMARQGGRLGATEIDDIFAGLDLDSSGKVNFTEFMAAALGRHKLDEARLRYAFERLDYDHDGSIDVEDLQMMVGSDMTEEQVKEAIKSFDLDGDGRVAYSEFFQGMRMAGQSVNLPAATHMTSRRLSLRDSMLRNSLAGGVSPAPSAKSAPDDLQEPLPAAHGPARLFRRASKPQIPAASPPRPPPLAAVSVAADEATVVAAGAAADSSTTPLPAASATDGADLAAETAASDGSGRRASGGASPSPNPHFQVDAVWPTSEASSVGRSRGSGLFREASLGSLEAVEEVSSDNGEVKEEKEGAASAAAGLPPSARVARVSKAAAPPGRSLLGKVLSSFKSHSPVPHKGQHAGAVADPERHLSVYAPSGEPLSSSMSESRPGNVRGNDGGDVPAEA